MARVARRERSRAEQRLSLGQFAKNFVTWQGVKFWFTSKFAWYTAAAAWYTQGAVLTVDCRSTNGHPTATHEISGELTEFL